MTSKPTAETCPRCGRSKGLLNVGSVTVCVLADCDRENRQREYDEAQRLQNDYWRKRFGY